MFILNRLYSFSLRIGVILDFSLFKKPLSLHICSCCYKKVLGQVVFGQSTGTCVNYSVPIVLHAASVSLNRKKVFDLHKRVFPNACPVSAHLVGNLVPYC